MMKHSTSTDDIPNDGNTTTYESKQLTTTKSYNDQMGGAEHESDWEVYHIKYVKKIINKSIIEESRRIAAASNETRVVLAFEEETNTDKQKWVDSWCNDEDRELTIDGDAAMVINVDGFFRKNRKAGYGVIIRNRYTGVPFLAAAAHERPVSERYHQLQGVNRGLDLAMKYALRDIYIVHCSSRFIVYIARCYFCWCEDRDHNYTLKNFCKRCIKHYYVRSCTDEDFQLHIYPLIMELGDKFDMFQSSCVWSYGSVMRKYNKAADYLAKLQMNREEMRPQEFSEELKDTPYEETLGGDLMTAIRRSGYGTDDEPIFDGEYF